MELNFEQQEEKFDSEFGNLKKAFDRTDEELMNTKNSLKDLRNEICEKED